MWSISNERVSFTQGQCDTPNLTPNPGEPSTSGSCSRARCSSTAAAREVTLTLTLTLTLALTLTLTLTLTPTLTLTLALTPTLTLTRCTPACQPPGYSSSCRATRCPETTAAAPRLCLRRRHGRRKGRVSIRTFCVSAFWQACLEAWVPLSNCPYFLLDCTGSRAFELSEFLPNLPRFSGATAFSPCSAQYLGLLQPPPVSWWYAFRSTLASR